MENEIQAEKTSQITFEDVRDVVGELDPNLTNAAKIRTALGRGSFATIQKHLATLRESLRLAEMPVDVSSVPAPPLDLVNVLWASAFNAAQNVFLLKHEKVLSQRDHLAASLEVMNADFNALASRLDSIQLELIDAFQVRDSAVATLINVQTDLNDLQARYVQLEDLSNVGASQAALAASNELQLLQRDRIIERQALQATVDALTGQVGELKSLLSIQSRSRPPVAVVKPQAVATKAKK
jgi:Plasmid replication region DNA-binding N-term